MLRNLTELTQLFLSKCFQNFLFIKKTVQIEFKIISVSYFQETK